MCEYVFIISAEIWPTWAMIVWSGNPFSAHYCCRMPKVVKAHAFKVWIDNLVVIIPCGFMADRAPRRAPSFGWARCVDLSFFCDGNKKSSGLAASITMAFARKAFNASLQTELRVGARQPPGVLLCRMSNTLAVKSTFFHCRCLISTQRILQNAPRMPAV
jgi:hypothetical protein